MPLALIIEDNAINRKLLRDIMEIRFEVLEAGSAEDAAEMLQAQTPDLILTDVNLPGIDGLTFAQQLKSDPEKAAIPIVAVSAYALPENIARASACGCAEFISKPLLEDPFEIVDRMLSYVS